MDGILLFRPKALQQNNDIEPGENFKFRITRFDLMVWESVEEKTIDLLAFEKNAIEKFWNVIDATREKSGIDKTKQLIYIKMELFNWSYDDIFFFDSILGHLSTALSFNDYFYKERFKDSVYYLTDFYQGIVSLGKNVYKKALLEPESFYQEIQVKKYSDHPQDIEFDTCSLVQDVLEKKMGKSIQYFSDSMLRDDFEEIRKRIFLLLDQEFEIDWDKPTEPPIE